MTDNKMTDNNEPNNTTELFPLLSTVGVATTSWIGSIVLLPITTATIVKNAYYGNKIITPIVVTNIVLGSSYLYLKYKFNDIKGVEYDFSQPVNLKPVTIVYKK